VHSTRYGSSTWIRSKLRIHARYQVSEEHGMELWTEGSPEMDWVWYKFLFFLACWGGCSNIHISSTCLRCEASHPNQPNSNCGNHFPRPRHSNENICKSNRFQADYDSAFTIPTTLYRFEKKVIQSLSVPCSFSGRSFQSGRTSSALVEVRARAREASWPANTRLRYFDQPWFWRGMRE
jgi:hypothetical protein